MLFTTQISVEFANSQVLAGKLLNHELDVAVIARELVISSFHALAFATDSLAWPHAARTWRRSCMI
jgi:hypothetical protein